VSCAEFEGSQTLGPVEPVATEPVARHPGGFLSGCRAVLFDYIRPSRVLLKTRHPARRFQTRLSNTAVASRLGCHGTAERRG
jgi:hypothetical protein